MAEEHREKPDCNPLGWIVASNLASTRVDDFGDVVPVENDGRSVTASLAAACDDLRRALRRMKLPENVRPATTPYDPENPY